MSVNPFACASSIQLSRAVKSQAGPVGHMRYHLAPSSQIRKLRNATVGQVLLRLTCNPKKEDETLEAPCGVDVGGVDVGGVDVGGVDVDGVDVGGFADCVPLKAPPH